MVGDYKSHPKNMQYFKNVSFEFLKLLKILVHVRIEKIFYHILMRYNVNDVENKTLVDNKSDLTMK